jgi:hypothetical protein
MGQKKTHTHKYPNTVLNRDRRHTAPMTKMRVFRPTPATVLLHHFYENCGYDHCCSYMVNPDE